MVICNVNSFHFDLFLFFLFADRTRSDAVIYRNTKYEMRKMRQSMSIESSLRRMQTSTTHTTLIIDCI